MKIGSVSGEVLLRGNAFKIGTYALARSIITLNPSFTGTSLILEDNKISATNATRVGVDNLPTNTTIIILLGNVLTKATINKRVTDVSLNNIVDDVVSS